MNTVKSATGWKEGTFNKYRHRNKDTIWKLVKKTALSRQTNQKQPYFPISRPLQRRDGVRIPSHSLVLVHSPEILNTCSENIILLK